MELQASTNKSLIISGMHRSGTSIVANSFHNAGLHLGENLLKASPYNPKGYYENIDIINFHDNIFYQNKTDWYNFPGFGHKFKLKISKEMEKTAYSLVNKMQFRHVEFGWKDPRTTLFLEFWNTILPDSKYIFVFREPSKVVVSLLKRGDFNKLYKHKIFAAYRILHLWNSYNKRIIKFYRKYPQKCILIKIPDDILDLSRIKHISNTILLKWGFTIDEIEFIKIYDPAMLETTCPKKIKFLSILDVASNSTYQHLSRLHKNSFSEFI